MKTMPLALGGIGVFAGAATLGCVGLLLRDARLSAREMGELRAQVVSLEALVAADAAASRKGHGRANVLTGFNPDVNAPKLRESAFVDPMASVIGDVELGGEVYVAPFASIRGDEGQPIAIGDETNVQDGVVIHALETLQNGQVVPNRTYAVDGRAYAVYVGKRVSMAHQSQVHGPARVDDDVFIGMQALVFKAWIGRGVVVEPGAKIVGVTVPPGRYVPAGTILTSQAAADKLPEITDDYPFKGLNEAVVHVNTSFAERYGAAAQPGGAAGGKTAAGHGEVATAAESEPKSGH